MDPISIFGLILSAVVTAVGIAANQEANDKNIENQNQILGNQQNFARESAATANQETRNLYNELYSPEARAQQYKDAGLSVGLMYSNGFSGGGTTAAQAATPSAGLTTINPIVDALMGNNIMNAMKAGAESKNTEQDTELKAQSIANLQNEIEVNNASIEKILKDAGLTEQLTKNAEIDGKLKQIGLEIEQAVKDKRIDIVKQELNNLKQLGKQLEEQTKGLELDNKYKDELNQAQIKKFNAEIALIWEQKIALQFKEMLDAAKTDLTEWQSIREQAQTTYFDKLSANETKKGHLYVQQWDKVSSEIALLGQQYIEIQANIKRLKEETTNLKWDRGFKTVDMFLNIFSSAGKLKLL